MEKFYESQEMDLNENGAIGKALWIDKNQFLNGNKILYPVGIAEYLQERVSCYL